MVWEACHILELLQMGYLMRFRLSCQAAASYAFRQHCIKGSLTCVVLFASRVFIIMTLLATAVWLTS